MRRAIITTAFARLVLLQIAGALILPGLALGCPPSKSYTTSGPDDQADVVLAGGAVAAIRTAGPFEVPWAVALLPDGSFLVTERPGRLQHIRPGIDTRQFLGTPPVLYARHGGLLDVALDPAFSDNGIIYLSFLQGEESASTVKVLRAQFDADSERLVHQQVIFEGTPGPSPEMLGGRIAVTGDGYLFLSLGDRWNAASARDLSDTAGSIIRINTDGTISRPIDCGEQRAAGHRAAGAILGAVLDPTVEPRRGDPALHHRNLDRRAGRRDGGPAQPRRQLRAQRAAPVAT